MDKNELQKFIDEDLSISKISKLTGKSKTTVTYWLNKFSLKTNHESLLNKGVIEYGDTKHCPKCNDDKPLNEFYNRRGKIGGSVYCKSCSGNQVLDRKQQLKLKAIEYKGGCCKLCGYDKYVGALDFHHLDPNEKDFSLGRHVRYVFNDEVKKELDKCILLCSNCHREVHGNFTHI